LQLERPAEALPVLEKLPATMASKLLRARALIDLGQWAPAQALLESIPAAADSPAEFHRLLGDIYAHQQDWPKATAEYRAALAGPASGPAPRH
jgi:uncharacterized protein HemY